MPNTSNAHALLLLPSEGTQVSLVDYIWKHVSFIMWHSWAHALPLQHLGESVGDSHKPTTWAHIHLLRRIASDPHGHTLWWQTTTIFFSPHRPLSLSTSLSHTQNARRKMQNAKCKMQNAKCTMHAQTSQEISNNFFNFTRSFQSSFPKSSL